MPHRPEFNPNRPLVAARDFFFAGQSYSKGDKFPRPDTGGVASFSRRLIERQYGAGAVNHSEEDEAAVSPVEMKPAARNGSYEITAPWLDEPEVVRGKKNAEDRVAELQREGAPLGWIEGGSVVTLEGPDAGGYYDVGAPWLDEPERVQGREAAQARQLQIHQIGEPETHHGVTLRPRDNGYWEVSPEGAETPELVHGEEAARERAAALRAGEPPSGATEGQPAGSEGEQGGQAASEGDNEAPADEGAGGPADGQEAAPAEAGAIEGTAAIEPASDQAPASDSGEAGAPPPAGSE